MADPSRSSDDNPAFDACAVGRGALTKPWIFQEFASGEEWAPSAAERVAVFRQLVTYMKEHFGATRPHTQCATHAVHLPSVHR